MQNWTKSKVVKQLKPESESVLVCCSLSHILLQWPSFPSGLIKLLLKFHLSHTAFELQPGLCFIPFDLEQKKKKTPNRKFFMLKLCDISQKGNTALIKFLLSSCRMKTSRLTCSCFCMTEVKLAGEINEASQLSPGSPPLVFCCFLTQSHPASVPFWCYSVSSMFKKLLTNASIP